MCWWRRCKWVRLHRVIERAVFVTQQIRCQQPFELSICACVSYRIKLVCAAFVSSLHRVEDIGRAGQRQREMRWSLLTYVEWLLVYQQYINEICLLSVYIGLVRLLLCLCTELILLRCARYVFVWIDRICCCHIRVCSLFVSSLSCRALATDDDAKKKEAKQPQQQQQPFTKSVCRFPTFYLSRAEHWMSVPLVRRCPLQFHIFRFDFILRLRSFQRRISIQFNRIQNACGECVIKQSAEERYT